MTNKKKGKIRRCDPENFQNKENSIQTNTNRQKPPWKSFATTKPQSKNIKIKHPQNIQRNARLSPKNRYFFSHDFLEVIGVNLPGYRVVWTLQKIYKNDLAGFCEVNLYLGTESVKMWIVGRDT